MNATSFQSSFYLSVISFVTIFFWSMTQQNKSNGIPAIFNIKINKRVGLQSINECQEEKKRPWMHNIFTSTAYLLMSYGLHFENSRLLHLKKKRTVKRFFFSCHCWSSSCHYSLINWLFEEEIIYNAAKNIISKSQPKNVCFMLYLGWDYNMRLTKFTKEQPLLDALF